MGSTERASALPDDHIAPPIAAVVDGDLAAFVGEHYDRLVRLARLVCDDTADAGDAVQIGLEQAWRRRSSLRDPASMRPWLDKIVVREAIRVTNGRRSVPARLLAPVASVGWIDVQGSSAQEMPSSSGLEEAYAMLSAEQRAVVGLHLYAGYSINETARIIDAPVETIRSRLRLAKERLRRELSGSER